MHLRLGEPDFRRALVWTEARWETLGEPLSFSSAGTDGFSSVSLTNLASLAYVPVVRPQLTAVESLACFL